MHTALVGLSLLGCGIQAGALLMVYLGVCPTFRAVEVPEWMRWHVSLDRSIERYMPALNVLTSLSTLVLLFLSQPGEVRLLRGLALACNVSLALLSELVNVRMNKQIARTLPVLTGSGGPGSGGTEQVDLAGLAAVRDRWISWHGWRTLVIVTGFVLYIAAVLVEAY